jgi:GntR family transcriptional regulator, transcriptional repressor for pyruvate dehydrogenase complex
MASASPDNSSTALGRLRALIRALAAQGEARLPAERELAAQLGLGRRGVRRALEVLEAEGRIWRQQGKGTFLGARPGEPTEMARALGGQTNFYEVMEARLRLEPQLAFLAAIKASDAEVARMRALCTRIVELEDADARELWDGALHRQIARATGNRLLLGLFDVIDQIRQNDSWTELRERARRGRGTREYCEQHAAIVDAVAARDPGRAEAAMRRHIIALQQNLVLATEGELSAAE